MTTADIMITWR